MLREAKWWGVDQQCQFFEAIPPGEVARIVSQSKVALHLSRAEGANKATYEAFFCDTPVIVFRHNVGFCEDVINEETGMFADDDELADAILSIARRSHRFQPRRWALANTGYAYATETLNSLLKQLAGQAGEPWTNDIVPKINSPNLLYANEADRLALEPTYADLLQYMREE